MSEIVNSSFESFYYARVNLYDLDALFSHVQLKKLNAS